MVDVVEKMEWRDPEAEAAYLFLRVSAAATTDSTPVEAVRESHAFGFVHTEAMHARITLTRCR